MQTKKAKTLLIITIWVKPSRTSCAIVGENRVNITDPKDHCWSLPYDFTRLYAKKKDFTVSRYM